MRADNPEEIYIYRQIDDDLYNALKNGESCYVTGVKGSGKSRLAQKTRDRLKEEGYECILIDFSQYKNKTALRPWLEELSADSLEPLGLMTKVDSLNSLFSAISTQFDQSVIFFDSLESIDESLVRHLYEIIRHQNSSIYFAILEDLTRSKNYPKNLKCLPLQNFSPEDFKLEKNRDLVKRIDLRNDSNGRQIIEEILARTNRDVEKTSRLIQEVLRSSQIIRGSEKQKVHELSVNLGIMPGDARENPTKKRGVKPNMMKQWFNSFLGFLDKLNLSELINFQSAMVTILLALVSNTFFPQFAWLANFAILFGFFAIVLLGLYRIKNFLSKNRWLLNSLIILVAAIFLLACLVYFCCFSLTKYYELTSDRYYKDFQKGNQIVALQKSYKLYSNSQKWKLIYSFWHTKELVTNKPYGVLSKMIEEIREVNRFSGNRERTFKVVSLSKELKYLAAGDNDGSLYLWDLKSLNDMFPASDSSSSITALAFSNGETMLASGNDEGYLHLYDVNATNKKIVRRDMKHLDNGKITDIKFTPDDEYVIFGDARGKVYKLSVKSKSVAEIPELKSEGEKFIWRINVASIKDIFADKNPKVTTTQEFDNTRTEIIYTYLTKSLNQAPVLEPKSEIKILKGGYIVATPFPLKQ